MAASSSSSSGEQQYSLRWNDFHSSILSSFRHLRDEEDFVDVTLACDSSSFTAHKVVLSACSPYFRRLLKANPCQHPIVILRDVASSDMESLLRFMYHGEVNVGQEQLTAFLKTAQMLQVRGLADVNSGANKIPQSTSGINNGSNTTTPRLPWHDSGGGGSGAGTGGRGGTRGGDGGLTLNDSGLSPPPEKRPRSYSPPLIGNHVEQKSELQESLLGQALEGGPTIHTTPGNNLQKGNHDNSLQAQSTGEDSNSLSENEEDMSNNDSMLNSVKTEPADIMNDSMEHHRSTFPAALLGLQGLMPGPSGIHAANQDPSYGRWQPSGGEGSATSTGWVPGGATSSSRNDQPGTTGSVLTTGESVILVPGTTSYHGQQQQQQQQQQQILNQKQDIITSGILNQGNGNLSQQQQQQQVLQSSSNINTDQLIIMQQKLQENIQNSLNNHNHNHNINQQQQQQQQQQSSSSSSSISTSLVGLNSCFIKNKKSIDTTTTGNISTINIANYSHNNHNLDNNIVIGGGGGGGIGGLINNHVNNNGKPKCPECGKIYSNNSNLKQHIVNVHTIQTEYISCHVCSKQFKTKQYLQIHLLSMHGIRKRKSYPVYQLQNNNQTTEDNLDNNQQILLSSSNSQINQQQQQQQQYHNSGQSNTSRWNDDKN